MLESTYVMNHEILIPQKSSRSSGGGIRFDIICLVLIQLLSLDDLVSRFRPNLVVSGNGMEPYEEDEWSEVTIGGQRFKVTYVNFISG